MTIDTIFRSLVNGKFMKHFDYLRQTFTFLTVFYITPSSYRWCPCSFEHEYIEYITASGEINEELYEKIVNCIMTGSCPHVEGTPEEMVTETSVDSINLAAAAGTREVFKEYFRSKLGIFKSSDHAPTGLFKVHVCEIAAAKNKTEILRLLETKKAYVPENLFSSSFNIKRSPKNSAFIRVGDLTTEKLAVLENNESLFKRTIDEELKNERKITISASFNEILAYMFAHDRDRFSEFLIKYIPRRQSSKPSGDLRKIRTAIVYDKPDALRNIIKSVSRKWWDIFKLDAYITCSILKRLTCMEIITKSCHNVENEIPDDRHAEVAIELFVDNYESLHEELLPVLLENCTVSHKLNGSVRKKEEYFGSYIMVRTKYIDDNLINATRLLLQHGFVVDKISYCGRTPLANIIYCITCKQLLGRYPKYRELMELFLYENPDWKLNELPRWGGLRSFFEHILEADVRLGNAENVSSLRASGVYKIDNEIHYFSGHDDAMNFILPLFIECGMPVKRHEIWKALEKTLHPSEREYLQCYLDEPFTLQKLCRITLRQHFPGHQIHKYTESAKTANRIKDFILLKDVLPLRKGNDNGSLF